MLLGLAIFAVGCSMHRVDVVQGNYIDETRLENLAPGMTKHDVQLLLGTPLVMDVYEPDVWYYVFFQSTSSGDVKQQRTLKLYFNQNGQLVSTEDSAPVVASSDSSDDMTVSDAI